MISNRHLRCSNPTSVTRTCIAPSSALTLSTYQLRSK